MKTSNSTGPSAKNVDVFWILNGCGLEGEGLTGGPVRFHQISRRFAGRLRGGQHLLTTTGGRDMQRKLGCSLPMTLVPASLFLRKEPHRFFRFWSYLVTSLDWKRVIGKLPRPTTVVTVSDYFCDVVPALSLKRRTGAKWIAWIHHCETDPRSRPGNRIVNEVTSRMQRWSFRRIARFADAAWISGTSAGDEIEARLLSFGMPKERIRRMKDGINVAAVEKAPHRDSNRTAAVMVGVRPNKGLDDIVPIWSKLQELRPGTTLKLMGGMSGTEKMEKDIRRLGLPIEVFRAPGGFLPETDYYGELKASDILFAPSHEEGWGIVVCEAMAAGMPVVAYDLPVYRDIYGDAIVRVPCFDRNAFAETLAEVLGNPGKQESFRRLGFEASRRYDWDVIADEDFAALSCFLSSSYSEPDSSSSEPS